MKFVIFTHVPHSQADNLYYAYAPYVREMNIWGKQVDELLVVAPFVSGKATAIDSPYEHQHLHLIPVPSFDLLSVQAVLLTLFKLPGLLWTIFKAMQNADHIHLRCPGNIGLLGCLVQILFPNTPKTAKYAGNWDPKSQQPWTYRMQKWILSSTFLTKNMQVLVYGEWEGSSPNITPFFTATYSEAEQVPFGSKDLKMPISFVFVGALVSGKNPLYAIQFVETLLKKGYDVQLHLYGEGVERVALERYILARQLEKAIVLMGNQSKAVVQQAYQDSHFVLLPSASEGWPKAIAEGMFWGCVPIATSVSCVPFMLDYGTRGILLEMNLEKDADQMEIILNNQSVFDAKQSAAAAWSRIYTSDLLESEIKKLLHS
ncbi:glycosyltransferase [Flavobacterium lacustre]|uniref:glycosyltransferase n=1 Tax=Flavobacterium lacustre TaxID=3016339 RepID=UPI0022B67E74|nr:glycosyltransferase [Flavobacterium lacustre]